MLGGIPVESYLIDCSLLRLKPVDMLFGIFDHIFKHVAGGEITDLSAVGNGLAEQLHILRLKSKICCEYIRYGPSSAYLVEMLHVRHSLRYRM